MSEITVVEVPSSLGLRPTTAGGIPGCARAPGVLRALGLLVGLPVAGTVVVQPMAYSFDWQPGDGVRNAAALADQSIRLADGLARPLDGPFTVVLGGDCAVLIGEALALRRRGRYGLAFLDGHSDFRHPGNSGSILAAAGEDLAIVTGRGDHRLVDLEGRHPLIDDADVAVTGVRADDPALDELHGLGIPTWPVPRLRDEGTDAAAARILERVARPELDGFWVHLDVDVLDASVMPAVDSPAPGGLSLEELGVLLGVLTRHPAAVGLDICIYDPDLDPDRRYGSGLARTLHDVLEAVAAEASTAD